MSQTIRLNGLTLDLDRAELHDAAGQPVNLRAQSMAVLVELARRRGELVTKRELMATVWPGVTVTDDSIVQCIVDIRRALGDPQQRLLRTLPRRGYTLVRTADDDADATPAGPAAAPAVKALATANTATIVPASASPAAWASRRSVRAIGVVIASAALLIAGWQIARDDADRSPASAEVPRSPLSANVAVLPLRTVRPGDDKASSARTDTDLDGEGLAYLISGELARNAEMRVASTLVTGALLREGLTAQQIGKRLDVRYVVDGSFVRRGDRLQIDAQLIDSRNDRVAWAGRFEPNVAELPAATDALVEQVARSLGATVRELRKSESLRQAPASLDVYTRVLRGIALKHRLVPDALRQGRLELAEALRLDPAYAPAWLYYGWIKGVAINNRTDSELTRDDLPQAIAEVRRSIAIDPTLPTAWQGLSVMLVYAGEFEQAIAASERSVKLGPGDPDNWLFLGMAQHNAGQHEASLANVEKAMAWNPMRPSYYPVVHAFAAYGAGRHAEALASARECIERAPVILRCKAILLSSLVRLGKTDEAQAAWPGLLAGAPALQNYRAKLPSIDDDLDRLRGGAVQAPR